MLTTKGIEVIGEIPIPAFTAKLTPKAIKNKPIINKINFLINTVIFSIIYPPFLKIKGLSMINPLLIIFLMHEFCPLSADDDRLQIRHQAMHQQS